jgi:sulfite reductase (NADPH) flavoprotein alpha-component
MTESNPHQTTPAPYNRRNPFLAELIRNELLTKPGSAKDTRHFVLTLHGSGLAYVPGDSLGVYARNAPKLVEELLSFFNFNPFTLVKDPKGQEVTLQHTLFHNYILNRANRKIMTGMAERIPSGEQRNRLMELINNDELLSEYLHTRDYVDVMKDFHEAHFDTPVSFLAQLSPIPPRLYSIASSLAVHPEEAHLCIAVVRYKTHERDKTGLASGFFADHAPMHARDIPVYIQEARHFRLPTDNSRDIIMVGPGTGIAPFRAFMEQRIHEGATGRNWLIFGEQRQATDFLYGEELTAWHRAGKLQRLDLAFSRDQVQKLYVQHRIAEHGREFWEWLQSGAYLYVCGDAKRMAKDVHQTIIELAQKYGGMSPESAGHYVNDTLMKKERRYLRDVY